MIDTKLSGREKAAVLLVTLGQEASAEVLKHLRESEIEQLMVHLVNLDQVSSDTRREVIDECVEMALAKRYIGAGGIPYAQSMLSRALGEEKASEVIARLRATLTPQPFDFLRDTDPIQLAAYIQDEQPQAIALVLSHLPPTMVSRVLGTLPPDIQAEVALRIATMERTPPEVIEGIEAVLRRRLSSLITDDCSSVGGVDYLVKVLSAVDRGTERAILSYLAEHDEALADEVMKQMFVFDNIIQLDDPSMQRVLREVDARDLATALRNADDELKQKIFRNLSARAAEMLREDLSMGPPVRLSQVEEAQQRVVTVVRRLEEAGAIIIQRDGEDALI